MTIINNNIYRFKSQLDSKYLNILTDGSLSLNQNVTTYSLSSSDQCQMWKTVDTAHNTLRGYILKSKKNTNYALDRWRGSSNYNNADIYTIGTSDDDLKDMMVEFIEQSTPNYYKIKLKYRNLYLTATSTSTYGGHNVDWESSNSSNNQIWKAELVQGREEVVVTNMPANAGYESQSLKEYFHPDAGMVNGTWANNGGSTIANNIREFYNKVFGSYPASNANYLYSLYGGKYVSGEYAGQYHPGIDMYLSDGATLRAARGGTITAKTSFSVTIQTSNCKMVYVHLNPKSSLCVGQDIEIGDVIGTQSSQQTTSSHLHIEIHGRNAADEAQLPTQSVEDSMLPCIVPYGYLVD